MINSVSTALIKINQHAALGDANKVFKACLCARVFACDDVEFIILRIDGWCLVKYNCKSEFPVEDV